MKKNLLFAFALFFMVSGMFAQTYPASFSYSSFVTGARDQLIQKPCFVHATVAGMEAMYKLYYGQTLDLSERAFFSCCRQNYTPSQSLSEVIGYAAQNGVILESCKPYPSAPYPCDESTNNSLRDIIFDTSFDCQQAQKDCGYRFKINSTSVSMSDINTIKKNLLSYGPIIFFNGDHTMLLIGWNSNSQWIVKDSYPCNPSSAKAVLFGDSYVNFSESYIITGMTKEQYNPSTNTWSNVTPAKVNQNFGLGFLKIVKKSTPSPLCYNRGIQYELQGLNNLTGAVCTGWTYEASANYNKEISLTVNGNTCTVAGNGAGVVLYAIIQRSTGIMEKIPLNIGNVGIPVNLSNYNGHCAGSNYEVTSQMSVLTLPNTTYNISFSIPSSPDGSYYAYTGGSNAWWVFKTPGGVQYSSTATATKTGCPSITNTKYSIVYGSFCGGYSYYYKSAVDSASNKFIEEDFEDHTNLVTPNPVRTDLTLTHVGEGMNDIRIYDLSGNLVYSMKTEETVTIDVSMIPRGVYVVKYYADKSVAPIKIILE